jgi:hypothetical protein
MLALLLGCGVGCKQQDTEALSRLGQRVGKQTEQAVDDLRGKLDTSLPVFAREKAEPKEAPVVKPPPLPLEPSLREKIEKRLQWENTLADQKIDVSVLEGGRVELRGEVKTPLNRQRAIELADTTLGVTSVNAELLKSTEQP